MGCASCLCGLIGKLLLVSVASILVLSFLPLVDIDAPTTQLDDPVVFDGVLQQNHLLSDAERLFENKLEGPESIAEYAGELYTGVVGGQILRLPRDGKDPVLIANITGGECQYDGLWHQLRCGRPLGMRFDAKGNLFVVDAFLGIKKVDIRTGKVETVFDPRGVSVDGQEIIFLDDIALDEGAGSKGGHVFYATDVSSKYDLDVCLLSTLSDDRSGRVLRYDADSGKVSVVAKGFAFPNGIELQDDKQAVIVSELAARKLLKITIKGKDSGKTVVLNGNLPCMVDNVRRSARQDQETYWLACFGAHKERDLTDRLREYPFIAKAALRFSFNSGTLLLKIGETLGIDLITALGYHLRGGEFLFLAESVKKAGLVLEADKNGQPLKSLEDPDGKVSYFSEVHEIREAGKRHLYLASFVNPYVVKVSIDDETASPVKPTRSAIPSKPAVKPAAAPTTTTTTKAPTKSTKTGAKATPKASPKPSGAKSSEKKKEEL